MLLYYGGTLHSMDTWDPDSAYTYKVERQHQVHYLDAKEGGTTARYINHSCDPNCVVRPFIHKGVPIMAVISQKLIKPLEFLSLNYGSEYEHIKICLCGSKRCKDRVTYQKMAFQGAFFSSTTLTL